MATWKPVFPVFTKAPAHRKTPVLLQTLSVLGFEKLRALQAQVVSKMGNERWGLAPSATGTKSCSFPYPKVEKA